MSEKALRAEIKRLNKIIKSLMDRAESGASIAVSDFDPFQADVTLEAQVSHRTEELESALLEMESIAWAFRESENRNRLLVENSPMCIHEIDMDGRIVSMNKAGLYMLGLKEEDEIRGSLFLDLVIDRDRERIQSLLEKAYSGEICHFEFQAARSHARLYRSCFVPIRDNYGNIEELMGIREDITEWKISEEELRESRRRLEDIIEFLPDATLAIDGGGKVIAWNRAIEAMTDFTKEEMLGKGDYEYAIPFYGTRRPILINFVSMWDEEIEKKYTFIKKDGDTLYTETDVPFVRGRNRTLWGKASPLYDSQGNVVGAIESIRDLTDRKHLEAQLIQAQKMEAIGALAGGIAHNFNNLLMGIQGYTSLIMVEFDEHHPKYEYLRHIEELVQGAADLTGQLLGFARGGMYEIKPVNINKIVKESRVLFGKTRKELTIHEQLAGDLWPVEADRNQIEQALLNLYVNAWHAMPSGGDIYLKTRNVVIYEEDMAFNEIPPGNYVKISVADTGVGMDELTRSRLFEPFFTTKQMGRGTGMGLAMVYGIIKGHGGFINVHSEPGSGTTFTIHLPASEKEVVEKRVNAMEMLRGTGTILIVDDEPDIVEVNQGILEYLGYTVHGVNSGQEAVAFYEKEKDKIDLIILDMVMPGLSGSDAFDLIKNINPSVRIILSSGYSLNTQAQQILDKGCDGFIQKPFNITVISRKIREVLDK